MAGINCISNISSIYASYMYPDSDAPRYGESLAPHPVFLLQSLIRDIVTAMSVNCATAFLAILAATALRFVLVRLNKKLDRGEGISSGEVPGQASSRGFRFLV